MNTTRLSMRSTHSNTRSSKNLDEENRKKAVRRANYKDAAQDVAGIVLSTLEQAAAFAPVPYLQQAAGLAIGLIDMVQSTSDNKAAFKSLATDACGLVYAAANVWKDQAESKDGKKIPQDLAIHLEEMFETMSDIMEFAEMRAARGFFTRFVSHKADRDKIGVYRVRLRDALDRFGMQSHITVRDAVARIQDQQHAILDALKDHATTEDDTNGFPNTTSVVESDYQVTPLTSQAPRASPPSPANPTASANLTINGPGTFNSIHGNYAIDNSTANNSSTNSGNVTNVSTVNSNNTYNTGRNRWANRWGRNGVGDNVALTKGQAMGAPVRSSGRRGRRRAAGSVPT